MNPEKFFRRSAEGNFIQKPNSQLVRCILAELHLISARVSEAGKIMTNSCCFERSAVKIPPVVTSGTSLSVPFYFHLGLREKQLGKLLILQALAVPVNVTVWCR